MFEMIGFSIVNWVTWVSLGIGVGLTFHLLDRKVDDLIPNFIASIIGAIAGGIIANFIFNSKLDVFNLSSLLVSLSGAFLLSFMGRMLRHESERELQSSLNPNDLVFFSEITKPKNHLQDVEGILNQVEYPISNRDLIRHAEKNQADVQDLNIMESLPDHIYQTKAEVLQRLKVS